MDLREAVDTLNQGADRYYNNGEIEGDELEIALRELLSVIKSDIETVEDETTYSPRQAQIVVLRKVGLSNAGIAFLTVLYNKSGDRDSWKDIRYFRDRYEEIFGRGELYNTIKPGTVANYYTDAKEKYRASVRAVEEGEELFE